MSDIEFIVNSNGQLVGQNLPTNQVFCITQEKDNTESLVDLIDIDHNQGQTIFQQGDVISIYQTDISYNEMQYQGIKSRYYMPTIKLLYGNRIIYLKDQIIHKNLSFSNLMIHNKIVSEIINNFNNKTVDSISMNDNIIYQRQNDIHVNEKIDTEFIGHNGIFLIDTDGNGLGGKEIKYQGNYSNQLVTYTHITQENGYTYIDYLLGDPGLKCILFEGDEEYNSCLYENSNYRPPNDPTNPIK